MKPHRKTKTNITKPMKNPFIKYMLLAVLLSCPLLANAQSGGVWRKTIVVSTLDGATMEYLIDKNTKVKIEKPFLVIETEGSVLTYELEAMSQLRYGKVLVTEGIQDASGGQPFSFDNETLYFDLLPEHSLVEVYTIDGKQTLSRRCAGKAQISLQTLSPGTYIVKVNQSTYKIVRK